MISMSYALSAFYPDSADMMVTSLKFRYAQDLVLCSLAGEVIATCAFVLLP
jgi:hypothetical protein